VLTVCPAKAKGKKARVSKKGPLTPAQQASYLTDAYRMVRKLRYVVGFGAYAAAP
jgi:hypothetical protein